MLFSTTGNVGHFEPLLPLARACVAAGHEVRVAAPESFAAAVERTGIAHVPFDDVPRELIAAVMGRVPTLPFREANATVVREVFGRLGAQAALPSLSTAMQRWRPSIVVREAAEVGSLAAAVQAGVPHVQMAIGMAESCRLVAEQLVEPLSDLARAAGTPEAALVEALRREPLLSSVPEVLDRAGDDAYTESSVAFRLRGEAPATSPSPLPEWGDADLPLVYVTFGSVTGSLLPFAGVFDEALHGLAALPVRVLMTVGHRVDLEHIGRVADNARVEAWRPQSDVLAAAELVLGHGGFGTTMGALAAGLPQVVAPIFTDDQVANARHVAAVGAGRAVSPGPDVVSRACAEVVPVLDDPAYRANAQAVATAIADLPDPRDAVAWLQEYAH